MNYAIWRWTKGIVDYWRIVGRLTAFFSHILGIRLLIKTLFWPWKRDLAFSRTQGFDIKEWFNLHVFNAFSRLIGFLIKLFTILVWIIWEVIWLAGALIFFPFWLFFPLSFIGLSFYLLKMLALPDSSQILTLMSSSNIIFVVGSVGTLLLLIIIEIITLKAYRLNRLRNIDSQNPQWSDPWFISLCAHLLVDPETLKDAWINEKLKNILLQSHLSRSEFDKIVVWEINRQSEYAKKQCWWLRDNLFAKTPFTQDWVFGWTFTLNHFSRNFTYQDRGSIAVINNKELEILKNNLAEGDGVNVAIIGESGIGRKRLVENLAHDLSLRNVPARLIGKKILDFQLDNLLGSVGEETNRIFLLEKALTEACVAGNIILFVPSLNNYLQTKSDEDQIGKVDIAPILTNFLENTGIQIITAATQQDLNNLFQNHPQLTKYFKIIQLEEPDMEDCLLLLCEKGALLENEYGKLIAYGAIKKALEFSNRYLQQNAMPKRALDFLEEAISYLDNANPQDHIIKEAEIELFASNKVGSPVGELKGEEKELLINLEEAMKKKIVGQEEAISAVASALRRRRLDLSNPERPAGCFLFLGPTGVGKTHTAEVLAELYYKGESRMARLDMSEYQEGDGINKLLGDASGENTGYFQKILSDNPFNLILLDELEKADQEVHQLLLQIMEEGIAKTGTGKKLNFRETIIIATSNAEALLIQDLVKQKEEHGKIRQTVIDKIQQDKIFSPELLNRFDEIVVFHPLKMESLYQVASIALDELKKRLQNKEIIIGYDDTFIKKLAQAGFDPIFGARQLRRIVEKQIEDAIAKDFLAGNIVQGKEFILPLEYLK